jgi:RNA polymerase sigma factor (sigma-70 family)
MPTPRQHAAIRHVQALFDVGTMAGLTDPQLLERFSTRNGEAAELAFAALVERHGPMVLRVCRGVLENPDEAHDAFQATFLVLVTRAGSLRRRESLASWLHGVALRVSRCARAATIRRRVHERRKAEVASLSTESHLIEDLPVIHEEFGRLPERYRAPMVLCDMEDRTHEQAARELGWPLGTVKSRLARGRATLRERLTRRGFAPMALAPSLRSVAVVPSEVVDNLSRSAVQFAAGSTLAGVVPASTIRLLQGVRRMMFKDGLRVGTCSTLALGLIAVGLALAAQKPPQAAPPSPLPSRPVPVSGEKDAQFSIEVRFCEVKASSWREAFATKFRLVSVHPPFTVWAVDRADLFEFLTFFQTEQTSNIIQAPKVTTFDGAPATIFTGAGRLFAFKSDGTNKPVTTERMFRVPELRVESTLDEVVKPASHAFDPKDGSLKGGVITKPVSHDPDPKGERIKEGVIVNIVPKREGDRVLCHLELADTRIRGVHEVVLPGAGIDPATNKPLRVEVPEVVQNRLEGEWSIGERELLVVSLGIEGIARPGPSLGPVSLPGKTSVRELLLVLDHHLIKPTPEKRGGAPVLPAPVQPPVKR